MPMPEKGASSTMRMNGITDCYIKRSGRFPFNGSGMPAYLMTIITLYFYKENKHG
jgi:hypothetical protein